MVSRNGWKRLSVLLLSTGIANVGNFIYLIAVNVLVFQLTGSAAAVAGLWVISPITNIVTKFWTGSFIDYRSKRKVMLITYLLRAVLIACLPVTSSMVVVYIILIGLSIANSFFQPASMTYTTILVSPEKRKRFNAIRSFTSSGAFIVGPAAGGALLAFTSYNTTLWINAALFVSAAVLLSLLPDGEKIKKETVPKLTVQQVFNDFKSVSTFMQTNRYVAVVYLIFTTLMVLTFAMDTQEVVFTQRIIGLSELDYSLLVSVTGIGSVVGAIILSLFAERLSLRYMISFGLALMTTGYIIYAFSWSFTSIAIGFVLLGFFSVFLNTGIMTFYQNNVPVELMGRVTSLVQLYQSVLQVMIILLVGWLGDIFSLRTIISSLAVMLFLLSGAYIFIILHPARITCFETDESEKESVNKRNP